MSAPTAGLGTMRVLKEISFVNYRAFRRGALHLKPITIIIGANSVGKTAILQLPLLLKQTASPSERRFRGALKLHGKDVSFGQSHQIFHNLDTSKPLVIEFGFESPELLQSLFSRARETYSYMEELSRLAFVIAKESVQAGDGKIKSKAYADTLSSFFESTQSEPRERRSQPPTSKYLALLEPISNVLQDIPQPSSRTAIYTVLTRRLSRSISRRGLGTLTISSTDLERCLKFSEALLQLTSHRFSIQFSLRTSANAESDATELLFIEGFRLKCGDKAVLETKTVDGRISQISSELVDSKIVDNYHASISSMVDLRGSIFRMFADSEDLGKYEFISLFRSLFTDALSELESLMTGNNFSHIGPLRAYPKRFYFLDPTYSPTDGDTIIEHLRDDIQLKSRVNEWLRRFDITINVSQLVNIISRLAVRSGRQNFDLDLTDVGFGISQILPIIVEGLLAPPGRTLLIEQPEIHLHPKMQAALGDLLIDIANLNDREPSSRRTVIVETHSEYLINRIRRRISAHEISHADIAIYYVEPASDGDGSVVRGINIPASGNFEWPKEFYDEDLNDSLDFLKNMAKKG
jgi:AAA ATPase-like protein